MNRIKFGRLIDNIIVPGDVSQEDFNDLLQPIIQAVSLLMPKKLYRYRSTTPYNIDALETDSVYTVTANKFNDPYDTIFQINLQQLDSLISATANVDFYKSLRNLILSNKEPQLFRVLPNDEHKRIIDILLNADLSDEATLNRQLNASSKLIINYITTSAPLLIHIIQTSAAYACFSEKVDSVTMWSHYSDYHRGYVLGYPKCRFSFDELFKIDSRIYPVIYSDKRFDGKYLFAWAIYKMLGSHVSEFDRLANIKAALHKSNDWAYENEWRLIKFTFAQDNEQQRIIPVKIVPTEIYYGLRISNEDKIKLHEIASKKKLIEYDMYIDNSSDKYVLNYKPSEWKKFYYLTGME